MLLAFKVSNDVAVITVGLKFQCKEKRRKGGSECREAKRGFSIPRSQEEEKGNIVWTITLSS